MLCGFPVPLHLVADVSQGAEGACFSSTCTKTGLVKDRYTIAVGIIIAPVARMRCKFTSNSTFSVSLSSPTITNKQKKKKKKQEVQLFFVWRELNCSSVP